MQPDRDLILEKYQGSGYTYLCEAVQGTELTEERWRITRFTDATGSSRVAYVSGLDKVFAFAATSLAVVAAYSYH